MTRGKVANVEVALVLGLLGLVLTFATPALSSSRGDGIESRSVPTAACNGEIQGMPYHYKGPTQVKMRLSAADAAHLVAFNGVLLAPRGWKCNVIGGSDGDWLKAHNPTAGFFPVDSAYQPQEAVSAYYATTGNHALDQACPYFPLAASEHKQLAYPCDGVDPMPQGEQQTRVGPDELDFVDPSGVAGTGNPSGGRYKAIGIELFDSFYDAKAGGAVENASTATCTLSPRHRHYCAAILRAVRAEFQHTLKLTR